MQTQDKTFKPGTLNRLFRLLRIKAGLSQKQIEALTGIGASKISYFENNLAIPSTDEVEKLSDAYQCTTHEILKCFL